MRGHTDRDTVNDRLPLTEGCRALLKQLDERDIPQYGQGNGTKNQFRALMDRGLAVPGVHEGKTWWRITDEGRRYRQEKRA